MVKSVWRNSRKLKGVQVRRSDKIEIFYRFNNDSFCIDSKIGYYKGSRDKKVYLAGNRNEASGELREKDSVPERDIISVRQLRPIF